MQTQSFFEGQIFSLKGTPQTISSIHGDRITYHYKRGGSPRTTTRDELRRLIDKGDVSLVPSEQTSRSAPTPAVLADLPEAEQKTIERRLRYIRALDTAGVATGLTPLAKAEAKQRIKQIAHERDEEAPGYSSVMRWRRDYLDAGCDPTALSPNHSNRGNRTERLPSQILTMIDESFEQWLQETRPTAKWVYGELAGRIAETNTFRDIGDKLPIPDYRTFCRRIKALDEVLVEMRRHGKAAGERALRSRAGGPTVSLPLERVEIDHTTLDLIVMSDDGLPMGRPTFTVALDKLTKAVVGFYISFTPPSYLSVMQCLRHALAEKSYLRERYPKIRNDWQVHGVPMLIVTDNGKEFLSADFRHACEQLRVSIQTCPPKKPWFKGSVERFLRTQNEGLIHNLPGTTKSNPADREEYDAVSGAAITLEDLDYLLTFWIVDIYMQSPHSTIGTSPAMAWKRAVRQFPTRTVSEGLNLDVILGQVHERRINNSRVQVNRIPYESSALVVLEKKMKPGTKVQVKVNPENLGYAHVLNPLTREYIEVKAVPFDYASGLTLHAHQLVLKCNRNQLKEDINFEQLRLTLLEFARENRRISEKKSKRTRKKAARNKALVDKVLADEAPATTKAPPVRRNSPPPETRPTSVPTTIAPKSTDAPVSETSLEEDEGWGFDYSLNK